jgi:hypothetical protein
MGQVFIRENARTALKQQLIFSNAIIRLPI